MPKPATENGHLRRLAVDETSGVDHPAHLHEGWVVMKSASPATAADVLAALSPGSKESAVDDEITGADDESVDEDVFEETDERDDVISDLTDQVTALTEQVTSLTKSLRQANGEDEETLEALYKEAPEPIRRLIDAERAKTQVYLQKALVAEQEIQKALDEKADAVAIEFVKSLTALPLNPTEVGPMLRQADPDLRDAIEKALTAADEIARTGGIFNSQGTPRPGADKGTPAESGSDAWGRITSISKALVADGKAASMPEAVAMAVDANPGLYTEYLTEKKG